MRHLIAVLVATLISFNGAAADNLYSWSGLFIGVHGGWEKGDIGGRVFDLGSFGAREGVYAQNVGGVLAGGQVGANLQIGRAVLGLELSGSWGNAAGHSAIDLPARTYDMKPAACFGLRGINNGFDTNRTVTCNAIQGLSGQVLAKFGYAVGDGRFLPYLTGGVSFTELKVRTSTTPIELPPGGQGSAEWGASKMLVGGVLGGGLQYSLGHGVSLGAEYLYGRYAGQDFMNVPGPFGFVDPVPENHDLTTHALRFVANYKFGG